MDLGIWSNPQEEIQERGVVLVPNPSMAEEDEYPFIAVNEEEVVEIWYWLVYQGRNPNGWRCPENRTEATWGPEYNCWRTANREDMKIITDAVRNDKAKHYKTITEKFKMASGEEKKKRASYIEIPMSTTFVIPEHNMIVRKWRDMFNWEDLGYGSELEEQANKVQRLGNYVESLPKHLGEHKVEW